MITQELVVSKKSSVLIAILILMFPLSLTAQEITFKHVSRGDVFSQRSVSCIVQDHFGFMWFGTSDGLNRYDGYGFEFYRPSPKDSTSLSDGFVNCLFEDHSGQLWVGTGNGLNLYSSKTKTFTVFRNDPKNPFSISDNTVFSIYEDRSNRLWIGTEHGGLNIYDPKTKKFSVYRADTENPAALASDYVRVIYGDRSGNIWLGTKAGLHLYNSKTNSFTVFSNKTSDPTSLSSNSVSSVYEDRNGRLWIGTTSGGLNLFDLKTQKFRSFRHNPESASSLSSDLVTVIFQDQYNRLWVGTRDGLNLFNEKNGSFSIFKNNPFDPNSLADNIVFSIYEDRSGKLWVGTYNVDGLNFYDAKMKAFSVFTNNPNNPFSLSGENVFAILKDKSDRIWVGTENGGLSLFDPEMKTFTAYKQSPGNPVSISGNNVTSLYEDRSGEIWVGTNNSGVNRFNPEKRKFTTIKNNPADPSSLSDNSVHAIFEDHLNRLWSVTNEGLNLLDRKTGKSTVFKHNPNDPSSLVSNRITSIYEDNSNRLWIGTSGGLSRYNSQTNSFKNFKPSESDTNSLGNNFVMTVFQDKTGNLWVGEFDGGLNLYNPETETFRVFREEHGMPNNTVYGILEDEKQRLWLSTNKGISRFDPQNMTFRNYDITDGLPNNEFNQGAFFRDKKGIMYFGVYNGICFFHPDSIKDDSYIPPVVLTGLEVFNKPIIPGRNYDGFVLPQSITVADKLELSYRESVFTLEFSVLNFAQQMKNRYAYRLEGFDRNWNYTDAKRRFATYTNLDPGTYIFHVRGSNHDDVWNEEGKKLIITITPPVWKTWWAYSFYVLCFFGLVTAFIRYRTAKTREKSIQLIKKQQEEARIKEAELRMTVAEFQAKSQQDEIENARKLSAINLELSEKNQQLKILNDKKNEYLGFAAHDLRAPLSGIIGYADLLISDLEKDSIDKVEMKQSLEVIHKVSNDMSFFISQLLDLASIESGKVHLEKKNENIAGIVSRIIPLHKRRAELKNIRLTVENLTNLPDIFVDKSKFESVVENLVSNAIKYTQPDGSIRIYGERSGSEIKIHIEDTGQGLTNEDMEKVFTTFTKLSARPTAGETSTGLGLAIVKKIVEIHGGKVWVKSEKGVGSTFSFSIPIA